MTPVPDPPLAAEVRLHEVVGPLRSGAVSLDRFVDELCDRIEATEPRLRAFLPEPGRRERLHREAAALDERFPEASARPTLFGVPVGVKDIINVDGLPTRAGSAIPAEAFAGPEATIVTRLREAGALIAGKTVTTEFAHAEPGATVNPHDTEHTPGGSSSGSAASVAAGTAMLALGSQTVGSVIRPAAFCGVTGFKPSYDRIPTDGMLYYSRSVDHIGLFTQSLAGMAIAAAVACESWAAERVVDELPVIGVPDGPYLDQADVEGRRVFEDTIAGLRVQGCTVRRVPYFEDIAEIAARHQALTTAEYAETHAERFTEFGALYRARSAQTYDSGLRVDRDAKQAGLDGRAELRERLAASMDELGIDVWASMPAPGPAPRGLQSTGNPAMNLPWTHAGVPTVTVPCGPASNGLPMGLQLSARSMDDERLLGWARAIERLL